MRGVLIVSNKELFNIKSCPNAAIFLLHKEGRTFIDSKKAYNCPLINNDYDLTMAIVNESSRFMPNVVELIVLQSLKGCE